jgi:hypothetical protein
MNESSVREEAKKSIAEGFTVFLVIVCVEGNGAMEDKVFEDKVEFPGVSVILLCKKSVQNFLGEDLVETLSSATALMDCKVQLQHEKISLKDVVKEMIMH